jgi:hypothetical protein
MSVIKILVMSANVIYGVTNRDGDTNHSSVCFLLDFVLLCPPVKIL